MRPVAIRRRSSAVDAHVWPLDLHPVLARLFAARGLDPADVAPLRLADLAAPSALGGIRRACDLLCEAIATQQRICVVGDFDCDGATGTAVAVRGLRLLGANDVQYRVPNRLRDGYGLTVGLVESLADSAPGLILTVDNGVASHAGINAARERGIRVVVTDHHLPGATLPDADAMVNPNVTHIDEGNQGHPLFNLRTQDARMNAIFPSRALAGVGVVFYLLLALRARLYPGAHPDREDQGTTIPERVFKEKRPDLSSLLDLVALGTVADLVPLDANNRILVDAGLKRIRAGRCCAGVAALCSVAGRDRTRMTASDLGFALGPRINAAGRLEDMGVGIECLLCDDPALALAFAGQLSSINAQRRELQSAMIEQAEAMVADFLEGRDPLELPAGIVLYEPAWHPGVVGLVASKLRERLNRPVVAFASIEKCGQENALLDPGARDLRAGNIELRGSARSVDGFHLRDALAEIDAEFPGLITRFGGHAAAAGLTMPASGLARFVAEFDAVARRRLDVANLESCICSDGELEPVDFTCATADALRDAGPWGQGFVEPTFDNVFDVESWRTVGERHLKLKLRLAGCPALLDAIMFNAVEVMPPPARLRAVFRLESDHWNGRERLQLIIVHIERA